MSESTEPRDECPEKLGLDGACLLWWRQFTKHQPRTRMCLLFSAKVIVGKKSHVAEINEEEAADGSFYIHCQHVNIHMEGTNSMSLTQESCFIPRESSKIVLLLSVTHIQSGVLSLLKHSLRAFSIPYKNQIKINRAYQFHWSIQCRNSHPNIHRFS